MHISCARKSDVCFASIESPDGNIVRLHASAPYAVENIAKHHSLGMTYTVTPRANAFWDGTKAMFASDWGYENGDKNYGYSDIYEVYVNNISPAQKTKVLVTINRNLSRGMRGADVISLQQFLFSRNLFASQNITGYFGPITRMAVAVFQKTRGLPAVGIVGPRTRVAMLQN